MNAKNRPPFECIALLLQGGGALGAYQGGVYQALSEAGLEPDWLAGISIGAINGAIIAGNAPENRVKNLRAFWEKVTARDLAYVIPGLEYLTPHTFSAYQLHDFFSSSRVILAGIDGFFKPRLLTPWLAPKGSLEATSYCDTTPLKATLESLVDFDRINKADIRFNIGAVNITSGDFISFDNRDHTITAEHVMASGALPPGLPAIKIGDDYFWDGGVISNTPLQWLLKDKLEENTLVFQIDLWSADGEFPRNMAETLTRQKDIQYSSRTRASTDRFREQHKLRHTIAKLLEKMPDELRKLPEAALLAEYADNKVCNIVHLIYHNKSYEGYAKDFEFSRLTMDAHWQAGYKDTVNTLEHPEVLQHPRNKEGLAIFDFSREKGENNRE